MVGVHISNWRFYRLYGADWQGNAIDVLRCFGYSKSFSITLASILFSTLVTPTNVYSPDLFSGSNNTLDHCRLGNAQKGSNGRITLCTVFERSGGQGKAGRKAFWGEDCLTGLYMI